MGQDEDGVKVGVETRDAEGNDVVVNEGSRYFYGVASQKLWIEGREGFEECGCRESIASECGCGWCVGSSSLSVVHFPRIGIDEYERTAQCQRDDGNYHVGAWGRR